ncbi:hypothetical protein Poli38472_002291 [Pythium oligandrum]|uniref:RING-type E3 ubiquitin transferase (cysteine targeting) n=1 Tax=Pythium oligandrum TaxID=41045 RepID=A0A8K1CII5_PYTOL|nr:hypothetical protein Poli38472_002291 [Pythium oligandrum]|eukprot:TMW63350.1 hypothetical protein Poli38472_002291 [Pythium oligandrum]
MAHEEVAARAAAESTQLLQATPVPGRVNYEVLRDPNTGLRVNKWDAEILDGEILNLLKTPFRNMFSMFEPGVVDGIKPEIDAVLGAMLFLFSTGLRRPTPGMKLENVQFVPQSLSGKKISALFVLSVGLPYAWKRVFRHLSLSQWNVNANPDNSDPAEDRRSRLLAIMKRVETLVIACQLANLLVFLHKGAYRSLPERILGMKMQSILPTASPRLINFEYMTRRLLWDGLMEFGNFVLPLLTWSRSRLPGAAVSHTEVGLRSTHCFLCGLSPSQTPYITSCKHVYCYYCLQTAVAADEDFACVACGVKFDSSQRLRA